MSIHPKYGGWFALRAVLICRNIESPNLIQKGPPNVLPDGESRLELLRRFNECWQDWSYRDVIPVEDRYSEEQKLYFKTPPGERLKLIEAIRAADT